MNTTSSQLGSKMSALASQVQSFMLGLRLDRVWVIVFGLLCAVALLDMEQFAPSLHFSVMALLQTAPVIAIAVIAIGVLKASGSETLVAKSLQGREKRMIVLAALMGGLSPFCSCEVIPFISALLLAGTPLSAVMAFWLASPLMDPAVFMITAAELGITFAIAKTVAAVLLGLSAGFVIYGVTHAGYFSDVLLAQKPQGCCGAPKATTTEPVWRFWKEADRRTLFQDAAITNGLFLLKWLTLAYVLESLMIRYIPAEVIASLVGGTGIQPIIVSSILGAPAYLNGYAAPALVSTFMDQGMTSGAGLAFMIAGGVTSIPAMTAVFALVKRPVFATYLGFGLVGAIVSGLAFDILIQAQAL